MFCRCDLRTTDAEAARSLYSEVVGLQLTDAASSDEPSMLGVWLLHEQARTRGAPPHWLGHVGVADVEATVTRMLALGSERLGPTVQASDGAAYATLRDPSGAVVAMRAMAQKPRRSPVAWHHHHTCDPDRAWGASSEVFGWTNAGTMNVAGIEGGYRMFAWDGSGARVGSMANTARLPGVHPHWLYFFPVADLDAALPSGDRLVPCHDPQGAAFGLCQSASRKTLSLDLSHARNNPTRAA